MKKTKAKKEVEAAPVEINPIKEFEVLHEKYLADQTTLSKEYAEKLKNVIESVRKKDASN